MGSEKKKVRIGIIGPGKITAHALARIKEISDCVKEVNIYDHGSKSLKSKFDAHETMLNNEIRDTNIKIDSRLIYDFDEFMDNSDVIIYSVGINNPKIFVKGQENFKSKSTKAEHFPDLEHILEREAKKTYSETKTNKSEDEFVGDFIKSYQILKEFSGAQDEGYFPSAFRTVMRLPANLPATIDYAQMMRDYYIKRGKIDNPDKLLVVNANSSENNLNAFLSIIPELKNSAISLAIDEERLTTLCNDKKIIPPSYGMKIKVPGVVGDHDSYIIPNLSGFEFSFNLTQKEQTYLDKIFKDVEEGKVLSESEQKKYDFLIMKEKIFNEWKENIAGDKDFFNEIRKKLTDYYLERPEELLADQAGKGIINIIKSINNPDKIITSGYFHDLSNFKSDDGIVMKEGTGLTLINKHQISWTDKGFEIVKHSQKLDETCEKLLRECKSAHVNLHNRFIENKMIPINSWPGEKVAKVEKVPAIEIIDNFKKSKREMVELYLPIRTRDADKNGQYQSKIVGFDLNTLGTSLPVSSREKVLKTSDMRKNVGIRKLTALNLGSEEYLGVCFQREINLLDPITLDVKKVYPLDKKDQKKRMVSTNPKEIKEHYNQAKINGLTSLHDSLYASHHYFGVLKIDPKTGKYDPIDFNGNMSDPIREVKSHHERGLIYYIQGNSLISYDPVKDTFQQFVLNQNLSLSNFALQNDLVYATTERDLRGYSYLLQGHLDHPDEGLKPVNIAKGKIRSSSKKIASNGHHEKLKSNLINIINTGDPNNPLSFSCGNKMILSSPGQTFNIKDYFNVDEDIIGLGKNIHYYFVDRHNENGHNPTLYCADFHDHSLTKVYGFSESQLLFPNLAIIKHKIK